MDSGFKRCACWIWLFLACISSVSTVGASSNSNAYNRANDLYRKGKYLAAVGEYEKALGQGVVNGYLYYNLGNAYYKSGQIGRAILSYERATRLLPDDDDIGANLRFANTVKKDKEPEEASGVLERSIVRLYKALSERRLALFGSLSLFCLLGAGVGLIYVPTNRMLWIVLLVFWGICMSSSALLLGAKVMAYKTNTDAIVLADELLGRSGPGSDFLQVFTIHEGTKAAIQRIEGEWMLIRLTNGVGGWVSWDGLERI